MQKSRGIIRQFGMMFRNGRWRSKWSLAFSKGQNECELTGIIKAQVKTTSFG